MINPPIEDFYQTKIRQEPLGLSYLKAALEEQGRTVRLLDALNYSSKKIIPYPDNFNYLKSHYPTADRSPFKLFSHYYHFGMPLTVIEEQVLKFSPDVIGISANFTPYIRMTLQIAELAKAKLRNVIVVLGGHHVSALPEDLSRMDAVDFIVMGEGERTFSRLIDCLSRKWIRCQLRSN